MGRFSDYVKKNTTVDNGTSSSATAPTSKPSSTTPAKKTTSAPKSSSSATSTKKKKLFGSDPNESFDDFITRVNSDKAATAETPTEGESFESFYSRVNEDRQLKAGERFDFLGNSYIVDSRNGQASLAPTADWRSDKRKEADAEKEKKTGHQTLATDLNQAFTGGLDQWMGGQLSTAATIPLAISGVAHKDNFYEPEKNSTLWKALKASSAQAKQTSEMMENSKTGRGKIGSTVMDVASQAVTNGIDAAIRSIPVVGQGLGTASFMSRAFGNTAQQKRDEGKSIATQVLSGIISAGVEQATESMSRIAGIRNYTGADIGWGDKLTTNIEAGIAKHFGPVIAKLATSMLSEGAEEIASDLLMPLITGTVEHITRNSKLFGDFEAEELQSVGDIAYDGLLGALSAIGGGMVESIKTSSVYNSEEVHRDNALYAAALRQEYEKNRAQNKRISTIYEALDDKFSRATKRSLQQAAIEANDGRFVTKKQALAMFSEGELNELYKDAAKKFSEQSFANEVVDRKTLETAAYNFLSKNEYVDADFQNIDDAKNQINAFAKEVISAYVDQQIADAKKIKGVKRAAKLMWLATLKAKITNQDVTTTQAIETEPEVTAYKSYGYSSAAAEAEQAAIDAELHPEQERPAYKAPKPPVKAPEGWVMRGDTNIYDPRNQRYIQKNNPELWAEYQKAKGISGDAGVSAMRDAVGKMKTYLSAINRDSNVSWQTEEPAARVTVTDSENKRIDKLFKGKQKGKGIVVSEAALETIKARAEHEGREVVAKKNGKNWHVSLTAQKTGNNLIDATNRKATELSMEQDEEVGEKEFTEDNEAYLDWVNDGVDDYSYLADMPQNLDKTVLERGNSLDKVIDAFYNSRSFTSFLDKLGYNEAEENSIIQNLSVKTQNRYTDPDILAEIGLNEDQIMQVIFAHDEEAETEEDAMRREYYTEKYGYYGLDEAEARELKEQHDAVANIYEQLGLDLDDTTPQTTLNRLASDNNPTLDVRDDGLKIDGKFKKDTAKAAVSNKFIGYAGNLTASSTYRYGQEAGDMANVGSYSADDVVFVSIVGNRASEHLRMPLYEQTLSEAKKALDSGATIITDNRDYAFNSEYNEGERWLYKKLKDAGYTYSEVLADGIRVGTWKKESAPKHLSGTMYFSYSNEKRDDIEANNTFDAVLNGERTATTREARWKGYKQWQNAKVGDTITFTSNADRTGDTVDVVIDGKYTVKTRIDKDTLRIVDDNGKSYKLSREQWSKKEGWAPDSHWFDEIKAGDIWLNYHLADPETSNKRSQKDKSITEFKGKNAFLSNMYRVPVTVDGHTYPSAENAFHALKCVDENERKKFETLDPKQAKEEGKHVKLKPNWDVERVDAMIKVLKAKFVDNKELYRRLMATDGIPLIEGNTWYDDFWGINGISGENFLGKLLMDLRDSTSNTRAKLADVIKDANSENAAERLAQYSPYDIQRAFLYVLQNTNIARENNPNLIDDISSFILGNFEKDLASKPYGLADYDETLDATIKDDNGKLTTRRAEWLKQNVHTGLARGEFYWPKTKRKQSAKYKGLADELDRLRNDVKYENTLKTSDTNTNGEKEEKTAVIDVNRYNEAESVEDGLDRFRSRSKRGAPKFNGPQNMLYAALDDNYVVNSEEKANELSDIQLTVLNLFSEVDRRNLNIKGSLKLSPLPLGYVDSFLEDVDIDALTDESRIINEFSNSEIEVNQAEDMVRSLKSSYDDGFPTPESIELKSSLMSGYSPSGEFDVAHLTVRDRLKLLRFAYPKQDFAISRLNPNAIVIGGENSNIEAEENEERWDKRHLAGGIEDITNRDEHDSGAAYGYIHPRSDDMVYNKDSKEIDRTPFAYKADGTPIYASGWASQEDISAEQKNKALGRINEANKQVYYQGRQLNAPVAPKTITQLAHQEERIKTEINRVKELLNFKKNQLVNKRREVLKRFASLADVLEAEVKNGVPFANSFGKQAREIRHEADVIWNTMQAIKNGDYNSIEYDDYTNFLRDHLNALESALANVSSQSKRESGQAENLRTKETQAIEQANWTTVQRNAFFNTKVDKMFNKAYGIGVNETTEQRLNNVWTTEQGEYVELTPAYIEDMVARIKNGTYGQRSDDELNSEEQKYAVNLYDQMFKNAHIISGDTIGEESVTAETKELYNLKGLEAQENVRRQDGEFRGWQAGDLVERRSSSDASAVRESKGRPRVSGYTGADSFSHGFRNGTGRVSYKTNGQYLSTYDDSKAGKGKQVGRILTDAEAVGEEYDSIRNRFMAQRDVSTVMFLDGQIFDSESGKLNDGCVITFNNNGNKEVVVIINAKSMEHEDTHLSINSERAKGNRVFVSGYADRVSSLMVGLKAYERASVERIVARYGGYSGDEISDEILANINAGIIRYGIDFGQWKDALSNSEFAQYLPRVDVKRTQREAIGANAPVANRTNPVNSVARSRFGNEGSLGSSGRAYYGTFGEEDNGRADIRNTWLNRLASDEDSDTYNTTGHFMRDAQDAGEYSEPGSVSPEEIYAGLKIGGKSNFRVNGDKYNVYVAHSEGMQDFDESKQKSHDFSYTIEVYDKNNVVTRLTVPVKSDFGRPDDSEYRAAMQEVARKAANCIGAYERGELDATIPMNNGVGSKAKFRDTLDKLFGGLSDRNWNGFSRIGNPNDSLVDYSSKAPEVFNLGNFRIEMFTNLANGERLGDNPTKSYKYLFAVYDNTNGEAVVVDSWPMKSRISPAWIISEMIHTYCLDNGTRVNVNGNRTAQVPFGNEVSSAPAKAEAPRPAPQPKAPARPAVGFGNEVTSTTMDELRARANAPYEERENRTLDDQERERLEMSDAEYYELRYADRNMPTLIDFEREQAAPKVQPKISNAKAAEMVERTFGSKGKVRATRVVEAFQRIKSPFGEDAAKRIGAKALRMEAKMGDMLERLVNVNDGFGTVKDVVDNYRTWADKKSEMSDYYSEEVAERFDKLLEDAEAREWTFSKQDQHEFAQAYEEACNAMMANIRNVNENAEFLTKLATEAATNKINVKGDSLIGKGIQKLIRLQISTDTAMKMFGGFKGSGEFYNLSQEIKNSVATRSIKFVEAYSHFDHLKTMKGFKDFAENKKTYKLEPNSQFLKENNPFAGREFTMQQVVTIKRLFETLRKTFEHSKVGMAGRVKGFVVRDAKGDSFTVNLGNTPLETTNGLAAIEIACDNLLNADTAEAKVAKEYSKACDAMFKAIGKDVSAIKKYLTGNALSLIGDSYTPVLWANEDGTPADFNFNDDASIKPPSFLYQRTGKSGYLVVSPISYIVDKYIENASDYIGTAKVKDKLKRLNSGNTIVNDGKGLNTTLAENFGAESGKWFDTYVKQLTEYTENDSIFAELRRRLASGALIGSPSVMMKQVSSYWSAMGLLSPEALTMAYRWKVGVKAADSSEYNKLLKHRKITGENDPTITDIARNAERYGNIANSRVFKLFVNGISEQDYKTVDNLYTATVFDTYIKNQNKDLEYFTSGQFQQDIDSKFTEVMMRSQPMFDVELRAEYGRTNNEFVRMTSMFRTQQTQNLNLIATAMGEYLAASDAEKKAKGNVLVQTIGGQIASHISLALYSAAADVLLHGLKKYRGDGDDKDDEAGDGAIEVNRVIGRLGLNAIESGASTIWGGDYLAKWLIDRMSGGETNEFYGVNFGPLTTFKNIANSLEYVAKSPTPSNIKNVVTNIAQATGLPINNIYRMVNSAIMYTADITGNNDKNYDDILKMAGTNAKVNKKNEAGRNLLIKYGMSKKEATGLVKLVDVDDDGLSKDDLSDYYIEHPEEAERVSILWDSMGWKQTFDKAKKGLDKKVIYNSNPLYAEMDEDESESVTKQELMNYYIAHPEQKDELEKMYNEMGWKGFASAAKSADKKRIYQSNPLYAEVDVDESETVSKSELLDYYLDNPDQYDVVESMYNELGFKGSFRAAIKSAEKSHLKDNAEEAFYNNDYNALFDSVMQMNNGKSWLTNMIKNETDNEYATTTNLLYDYVLSANLGTAKTDSVITALGTEKLVKQYKNLRGAGLSPRDSVSKLTTFDANGNGSITQAELADYYKAHKNEEALIAEFWSACGWSKSWKQYKKSKKIA